LATVIKYICLSHISIILYTAAHPYNSCIIIRILIRYVLN